MKTVSPSDRPFNVVIPCYNEEHRLPQSAILDFLSANPRWTATFVDDGSQDQTLNTLREMQNRLPNQISILKLRQNSGKAEAVRLGMVFGFEELEASYVGFADADLAAPLEELLPIARKLESLTQLHAGIGVRLPLLGRQVKRKKSRAVLGKVFSVLTRPILKATHSDTQCGLKLFRDTPAVRRALEHSFRTKWIFDVELFQRIRCVHEQPECPDSEKSAELYYEHPLSEWSEVQGSRLRKRDFVIAAYDLARLYILNPLPRTSVIRLSSQAEVIQPAVDSSGLSHRQKAG